MKECISISGCIGGGQRVKRGPSTPLLNTRPPKHTHTRLGYFIVRRPFCVCVCVYSRYIWVRFKQQMDESSTFQTSFSKWGFNFVHHRQTSGRVCVPYDVTYSMASLPPTLHILFWVHLPMVSRGRKAVPSNVLMHCDRLATYYNTKMERVLTL